VNLFQASVGNVGTGRPDDKGEAQLDGLYEGESTDAGHRGGDARTRDEGAVMALDQRGVVVRRYPVGNPKGEDLHG
jgi:hypothetical protein